MAQNKMIQFAMNLINRNPQIANCCCDYDRITVVNTGTSTVNVGTGATLFVRRVS